MSRILHVLISARAEGTPRLVLDWLSVAEHEQGVAFLSSESPELLPDFQRRGCWLQPGAEPLRRGLAKYPQIIQTASAAARGFRPDLVIAWPAGLAHLIHLGARSAGRAALLTHAGTAPDRNFARRYFYTWFCLGTGRLCGHRVVACSEYVRRQYLDLPFLSPRHILAAHNCCQVERFVPPAGVERRPGRACMVGSLETSKDYPNLLQAWKLVEPRGDFELVIAGGGSKRAELEALAARLALRRVSFLGAVRNVPELLWSSRVFGFSAHPEEGFGTVLIEALAAGCRIAATDVPACREVLREGQFGLLAPPGNPAALAEALVRQLSAPAAPAETEAALAYARAFSPARMAAEYLRLAGLASS